METDNTGPVYKIYIISVHEMHSIVSLQMLARFNAVQDPSDGHSGRAAVTSSALGPCIDASTPADGPAQRGMSGA